MKRSLLDMVQHILGAMSSDQINSLSDTEEALSVAEVIKGVYYELISLRDWPWLYELTSLNSVSDPLRPTHLRIPDEIERIEWIKYNHQTTPGASVEKAYRDIHYLAPDEFASYMYRHDSTQSNVVEVNDPAVGGVRLYVLNDRAPTYWTSFDDEFVIMDSWNSDLETTLEQSNNTIWAKRLPQWQMEDSFIPDLPDHMFPGFLEESKSTAFIEIKQASNPKSEMKSRRQLTTMQHRADKSNVKSRTPNYGRSRGGYRKR